MEINKLSRSVMESDHRWIRALIKEYDAETDPTKKQQIMDRMIAAKAKIDWEKQIIDLG